MKPIKRNVLLTPGPCTTTDNVKHAQVVADICPREEEFGDLLFSCAQELTKMAANEDDYATILLGGSGTAAVESILCSVVDENPIVIIDNGAYGRRMCEIAHTYRRNYYRFASSPLQPIDLQKLERFIDRQPIPPAHLAVVHNETTTGLLNDVAAISSICTARNLTLIVDAMSSFGAIPIDMAAMNIHYLAASANKCLQGLPGVGFVIAHLGSLAQARSYTPMSYYLDLIAQHDFFSQHRQLRFTPPVQTVYALWQAIDETKQEGIASRYARYCRCWETLVAGLARLQLEYIVPSTHHSRIVTAVREPEHPRYSFRQMHDYLYAHGFTLYPGKLHHLPTFRIANIGAIVPQDVDGFLSVLQTYLQEVCIRGISPSS